MSKTNYELHVRRDGRWRIEANFDDREAAERLARTEISVRGAEEVKVLKYRPFAGFEVEVCVYHRKAPEAKEGSMALGGGPEGAPACRVMEDFVRFESRLVAGRLLRVFLEKHQITVSELLHGWGYARRLDEQGGLLRAALGAVARWQADALGMDPKERSRTLAALADQVLTRLRNYNADRKKIPPLDWSDLARSCRRIGYEVGEADVDFIFMAQLTDSLQGCGGLLAKLEKLVDPWEETTDERVAVLLEAVIADALGSTEVVRELLGAQPNLAAGLATLADLLVGRSPALGGVPSHPLLIRIGRLAAEGRAPACRAMLAERIRASLAGDQPLDRRDPQNELTLIAMLEQRLLGSDGRMLGGAEVAKALARRTVRYRQGLLRNIGMHDVADAVGASRYE
jgi:hypothetical protein